MAVHGRYLILFRSDPNGVRVERILHSARRLPRAM
jgi:plasmid stabilization system protein ParE